MKPTFRIDVKTGEREGKGKEERERGGRGKGGKETVKIIGECLLN